MNLHIVPDNVFINKFYDNLNELGLLGINRIVVRTNKPRLQFIKHNIPFAKLYSSEFTVLIGETEEYDKVFIHQFTPLLYRWVANHIFNELNWMVWGADLYNLPSVNIPLYEKLTLNNYVRKGQFSFADFAYQAKVYLLHDSYRKKAYAKVNNVLTWMTSEYAFAKDHLSSLKAQHQFFFYENEMPYQDLDNVMEKSPKRENGPPRYILGHSSTAELNHLDAIEWMDRHGVQGSIFVPVSYGDMAYTKFLRKNLALYKRGQIHFIDRYMNFQEYLEFLNSADGLIMNNIRPQGYGNIFMMMYLGKKVFLNYKNLSLPELDKNALTWYRFEEMKAKAVLKTSDNRSSIQSLLSHPRLLQVYGKLFN